MDEQEEYLRATLLRDTHPTTITITLRHHGRTYTLTDIPTDQVNNILSDARDRGFTPICNACHQERELDPEGYCQPSNYVPPCED